MDQILQYFPALNKEQIQKFSKLGDLYSFWNEKINVVSRKDIESLYERHVLHSLAIARIISFTNGTSIVDIGTGGGFPGIPLAIMFPDTEFVLVDSIGKKIKVVGSVAESIGLKNVTARHQHSSELKGKFDFVISRAVTAFPQFVKMVAGKVKSEQKNSLQNGIIYLKGGDLTEELKDFTSNITMFAISDFFKEPFFETKYIVHYPLN